MASTSSYAHTKMWTAPAKTQKQIDYILVIKEENLPLIKKYTENLQALGFEIEKVPGKTVEFSFVKVVISQEALRHFSEVYNIGNKEVRKLTGLYVEPIYPNPFGTRVSRVPPKVKGEITDAEKIMIVNTVLEYTKFSEQESDYGLSKLIRLNILETAYPLHDGPITEKGENVRSLLFTYWSNIAVTHNQQPLDLIYRYYGTEIAFYFAWLEYFNIMLIMPSILGAFIFIGSAIFVILGGSRETQAYVDAASHEHRNRITGEIEPYTPKCIGAFRYTVTFLACAFLIGIIFVAVLLIVAFKVALSTWAATLNNKYLLENFKIISMCTGSMLQVICIKLFSKGGFKPAPHDRRFLNKDVCQPLNCMVDLCIQLAFLMAFKDLVGNCLSLIYLCSRGAANIERGNEDDIPQWEEEYFLLPTNRYLLTTEFTEMIIKYGFVTFFVAAFPLAPLCALVNNLIELRSDSYKLVKLYRRPVPLSKSGIGAWNGILLSVTYLSTATNAFVLAFTSDWVPRQVYRQTHGVYFNLTGYFSSTLSEYDTRHYENYRNLKYDIPYCMYRGYLHPSNNPNQYNHTRTYWVNLTFRFVSVFVFEHLLLVCNALFSYCMDKFPESVREQLDVDQQIRRNTRFAELEKQLEKNGKVNIQKVKSISKMIKLHRE